MKVTRSRLKEIIKEELRLLKENNIISEDGHTDVPSARRKMKTSVEDAMQILQGLEAMPDKGELPSWWMGKVTLAADYLNKARDYFLVSETKEELSGLTEEDHLADDDDFNVSQFNKLTFDKGSVEDHVRDAIQMLQRSPPDAIPFAIERLYIALETLDNHPTYSDKFVDDD